MLGCSVKAPRSIWGLIPAQLPVHVRSGPGEPGLLALPGTPVGPEDCASDDRRWTRLSARPTGAGQGGSRHHNYTGQRGLSPLLAVGWNRRRADGRSASGPGQHRPGRYFLRETLAERRRSHGTTHRAGRQRLLHPRHRPSAAADVRFSIRDPPDPESADLIEAIPEVDWTPIPSGWSGAAVYAETAYSPSEQRCWNHKMRHKRPKGSQLATAISFITDREGDTRTGG